MWGAKGNGGPPLSVLCTFYKKRILGLPPSFFLIWCAYCDWKGFGNLMFPLWFALLGGSFVFLDMGPSNLFLVFLPFWVLWFIYDWQGFIIYLLDMTYGENLKPNVYMAWWDWFVQDKEDNNIATTPISFFS